MIGNKESTTLYTAWVSSPKGNYALRQEEKLLQGMVAPWPRRKQKLVDIGCGTGVFLDFFWSCGFDLTGVEKNPDMLALAREKIGHRADLHLGRAEHLPFEDREFDYAALLGVLEFVENPVLVLREAARVARKGILISFFNRASLYGWSMRMKREKSFLSHAHQFSWGEIRSLIQMNLPASSFDARSVLLGPPITWVTSPIIKNLNSLFLLPWFGAVTVVRVDLSTPRAQTPLMAWKTEPTMLS